MSDDATTIWVQRETQKRMQSQKPEWMTYDQLVNTVLDRADLEDLRLPHNTNDR